MVTIAEPRLNISAFRFSDISRFSVMAMLLPLQFKYNTDVWDRMANRKKS